MKAKLVGLLVLALATTSCSTSMAASPQERAVASVVSLSTVVEGVHIPFCGGAVLNEHEILTAIHCMEGQEDLPLLVDGVATDWSRVRKDESDHLVIRVESTLTKKPVKMATKPLRVGDKVFVYGTPSGIPTLMYREGAYAGRTQMYGRTVDYYALQAWKGDSGSPVFNEKGELVATVSVVYGDGAFHLMGTFPYNWEK